MISGGPITTMDPSRPTAEAVVVEAGRIIAVGEAELAQAYPHAEHHDLAGRTLLPGFIDAHCHLSIAALQPLWADASSIATIDDLEHAFGDQARQHPDTRWLRADGWDELVTGLTFDRHDLDAFTGDRPAIVMHSTYHQVVLNSAGLDLLGLGREAARGDALIAVDEHGEPSGLLMERSAGLAHTASMADYTDPDRWADHIEARATDLLRYGITAVHDAACDLATEAVYARLAADGRLPISVLAMPAASPFLTNTLAERLDGPATGTGDETFRVGPLKFFADGGAIPAFDVHIDGNHMAMGYRHPDLHTELVAATERGFRVGVHAMGNVGVADTLDAFRAAARARPDDDHRFRIEHFGMSGDDLAIQAAELGAVGVVQPGFVEHVGRSTRGFEPDDATWLPFATLTEAGVTIAGSSDDPCGPLPPLDCARFGVHRHSEGLPFGATESVPMGAWLEAYTSGAAYAGGQEHERGSITPGKAADLVILDEVPTGRGLGDHDPVSETWVRGRLAYSSATAPPPPAL